MSDTLTPPSGDSQTPDQETTQTANSQSSAPAAGSASSAPASKPASTPAKPASQAKPATTPAKAASTPPKSDTEADEAATAQTSSAAGEPAKTVRRSAKKTLPVEAQSPKLDPTEETLDVEEVSHVVVTVGPKQQLDANQELETIDAATTKVYTTDWWLSLLRDEKTGKTLQFKTKLEGYPIYDAEGNWVSTGPLSKAK